MIRNFCIDVMITTALFGIVWGAAPIWAGCCELNESLKCETIINAAGEYACKRYDILCGTKWVWVKKGMSVIREPRPCSCTLTKASYVSNVRICVCK